jgi:hypothetical protein
MLKRSLGYSGKFDKDVPEDGDGPWLKGLVLFAASELV